MSVDDHGLEVLKKAAVPLDPAFPKKEYVLRTLDINAPVGGSATEATLQLIKAKTDALDVALSTRASEITLNAVGQVLALIKAKTDALDVALSTRASEVTLLLIKAKTDALDVALSTRATEATLLLIKAKTDALDVALSTRASEVTLLLIKAKTDALDVALSTRASEVTLAALNNKILAQTTTPADDALGVVTRPIPRQPMTYSASITGLVAVGGATDIFTITGSATRLIKIKKISIGASASNPVVANVSLIKRSTPNTLGTFSTPAAVPHDSADTPATAVVRAYTANPTLGTPVGEIRAYKITIPNVNPLSGVPLSASPEMSFGEGHEKPIVLRGVNEVLAINLNGITVSGNSFNIYIEWTGE